MNYLSKARKSKFFKDYSQMDFNALLRCLNIRIREYKANDIIENEGNLAKNIYIVLQGILRSNYIDEDGTSIPLNDYKKDMIYGLEYIDLKYNHYQEELLSLTDSIVLICDLNKTFNNCQNNCQRHLKFKLECIKELAFNANLNKKRIFELSRQKSKDKILKYLKNNMPILNKEFQLPYNRQELADYLGLERSALSNNLSQLKKEGYIDYNKEKFIRYK